MGHYSVGTLYLVAKQGSKRPRHRRDSLSPHSTVMLFPISAKAGNGCSISGWISAVAARRQYSIRTSVSVLVAFTEGTTEDVSARSKLPVITPEEPADARYSTVENNADSISPAMDAAAETSQQYRTEPFDNGYEFPPKHTWQESTAIGLKAFWKFSLTPIGFLVVIYGLNVVA